MGGGGGGGGAVGSAGTASSAAAGYTEIAAANSFLNKPAYVGALQAGEPANLNKEALAFGEPSPPPTVAGSSSASLEYKAGGGAPVLGPGGKPLPAALPSDFAIRQAYVALPEAASRTVVTTAPAVAPPPAASAPALDDLDLISDAKFAQAAKDHEVTMRQDIRGVEMARVNPAKRASLPVPALPGETPAAPAPPAAEANAPPPPASVFYANGGAPKSDVAGAEGDDNAPALVGVLGTPYHSDNQARMKTAPTAPATPGAVPAPVREGKPKLASAGESQPYPTSGYSGGGAYGGYSSIQTAPGSAVQEVAQAPPALRSPKESGIVRGSGGAVTESGHGVPIAGMPIQNVGDVPRFEGVEAIHDQGEVALRSPSLWLRLQALQPWEGLALR